MPTEDAASALILTLAFTSQHQLNGPAHAKSGAVFLSEPKGRLDVESFILVALYLSGRLTMVGLGRSNSSEIKSDYEALRLICMNLAAAAPTPTIREGLEGAARDYQMKADRQQRDGRRS
jgi:hypothetical protein